MQIGIVSKFPPIGQKHTAEGALTGYTKNLVTNLPINDKVIVYADKLEDSDCDYIEDGIHICRVWNKGILYPFKILAKILKHRPDIVHIQHEFFLYGEGLSSIVFLLLLLGLKLLRIPRIVTVHGIIPLSSIDKNFVKENKSYLPPFVVKLGFLFLTRFINYLSTMLIVHGEKFGKLLEKEYKCKSLKYRVIPLGIEIKKDGISKTDAECILGLRDKKVILFFGYITGYKGIDLLIDAFELLTKSNPNYVLIIAGGEHPRLKEYIYELKDKARKISTSHIIFTNFVPEDKIAIYFSASDIVVFPYTVGMASSASMSTTISYSKPFIVSDAFRDIVNIKEAIFDRNPIDLANKIKNCLDNEAVQNRLLSLSIKLQEERSWDKISRSTYKLYNEILLKNQRKVFQKRTA